MIESVLRRDRNVVAAALLTLTGLCWAYLVWLNSGVAPPAMASMANMPGMTAMPGMNMVPLPSPLSAVELAFTATMWAVMMVGMMTPSAAPMILLYARIGRQARAQGTIFPATSWFAAGYLAVWIAFAIVAAIAQAALAHAALITPMMAVSSSNIAGILLLVAGIWQWVPVKDTCLAQCQAPFAFLQRVGGFKRERAGAFVQGARHGFYCVGCCWALMVLLFVGGVMNLLWVAGLSIFVLVEKLLPAGKIVTRSAGLVAIAAGIIFLGKAVV
jgi:predicted metal-binding membrane protein